MAKREPMNPRNRNAKSDAGRGVGRRSERRSSHAVRSDARRRPAKRSDARLRPGGKEVWASLCMTWRRWARAILSAMRPDAKRTRRTMLIRRTVVCVASLLVAFALWTGLNALLPSSDGGSSAPSSVAADGKDQKGGAQRDGRSDASDVKDAADGKDAAEDGTSVDEENDAAALDAQAASFTEAQREALSAKARATADASGRTRWDLTYRVVADGDVGDLDAFAVQAYQALNDPLGWPRAGVTFTQVSADADCDFNLILAEAERLPNYDAGCSDEYSCRVGDDVIINVDRWNEGTEQWLGAGGTLRRYRRMAVNHEVGHRLGHLDNEPSCGGEGQPAPLMQQQSKGLNGCLPNEWPIDEELWTQ